MNVRQKKILNSISSLLSQNKVQKYGAYNDVVSDTNTNVWDGSKGWNSPRRWQRKSWIFFGAYSPDIVVGFAIVDAGFLGKAFCYIYFPKTGELLENGIDRPFAFDANFEANLDSHWSLGNYQILTKNGQMHFEFKGKKFQISLQCTNNEHGLSFVCPSTGNKRPFHYTYKNLLLPTNIQLTKKGQTQQFNNLYGGIDFSKGYPPKHTDWNWTSFLGKLEDGTPVGINIVDQFNQNLENAVWIGTERILIGAVSYQYGPPLEHSLWKVVALEGNLELSMQPNGSRKENINIKLLKSKFTQVFGVIEGRILHQNQWKKLIGYGVMEEHEAIW
ncbi:DUF2804 domain-containing protein [Aureispira anguillae]|uniref:DUF2804 domain-containing protein n=1 Tax=Aureispira anguillae TaxID=2864201 RepID=A0A915YG21_9BACT|nr:DUF2804 domain-containing protein [Aureispira anguillae]BDS12479.1 DUF2804 domain-containing protein [Aureispira anguillae]